MAAIDHVDGFEHRDAEIVPRLRVEQLHRRHAVLGGTANRVVDRARGPAGAVDGQWTGSRHVTTSPAPGSQTSISSPTPSRSDQQSDDSATSRSVSPTTSGLAA